MIISASRRTDIPAFYSEWFFNRIKEGFVLVQNPRNFRCISRISLNPKDVGGIVFWTKSPAPMLGKLDEIRDFQFYFQFTVTPYDKDIEPNLPPKRDILNIFKRLSEQTGADRVVWRYDPILLNPRYTKDFHLRAFTKTAAELCGYTKKVTISFIDTDYKNVKRNAKELCLSDFTAETQAGLAAALAEIAHSFGLTIDACVEKDLTAYGIERAKCVDGAYFSGGTNEIVKKANQRPGCGCAASVDIGAYNMCRFGCKYCYANYMGGVFANSADKHDPYSPLILGNVTAEDTIVKQL